MDKHNLVSEILSKVPDGTQMVLSGISQAAVVARAVEVEAAIEYEGHQLIYRSSGWIGRSFHIVLLWEVRHD